jgi:hypothetical protein
MKNTILVLAFVASSNALVPVPAVGQVKTFGPRFQGDDIRLVACRYPSPQTEFG